MMDDRIVLASCSRGSRRDRTCTFRATSVAAAPHAQTRQLPLHNLPGARLPREISRSCLLAAEGRRARESTGLADGLGTQQRPPPVDSRNPGRILVWIGLPVHEP